jgi:hypothetical protein
MVFAEEDASGKTVRPVDPDTVSPYPDTDEDSHASDGGQTPGPAISGPPPPSKQTPLPGAP